MLVTTSPELWRERMAASLPAPGPRMKTSTCRSPRSMPRRAAWSVARWAANTVPLRDPFNPTLPALEEAITFPRGSVMLIMVLLKVE